jgi:hypothetical protein
MLGERVSRLRPRDVAAPPYVVPIEHPEAAAAAYFSLADNRHKYLIE